jgi:hypothetical protein
VWYEIRTRINNREPLFRLGTGAAATVPNKALALFAKVFRETKLRFVFEVRGLCLADDWLTFYIKPADGLELPAIMKWLKQVFAQRYNRAEGRIGHIWGDRYGSWIMEGEPDAEPGEGWGNSDIDALTGVRPCCTDIGSGSWSMDPGVRPQGGKNAAPPCFPLISPFSIVPAPG